MKLSILICTIPKRKHLLKRLEEVLLPQLVDGVEILEDSDENLSIGSKRQRLINRAKGDYVCFIDDDDLINPDYVKLILTALVFNPQATHCSLTGIITTDGRNPLKFEHSIKYERWKTNPIGYITYERCPNHLNTIRRDLVLQIGFKDISHGEDRIFSEEIRPLLDSEAKIEDILYHYLFITKKV